MQKSNVFGAVRATTIAALCAGAGFALASCEKPKDGPVPEAKQGAAKPATEKPAGEMSCGGDKKCGGDHKCGGSGK